MNLNLMPLCLLLLSTCQSLSSVHEWYEIRYNNWWMYAWGFKSAMSANWCRDRNCISHQLINTCNSWGYNCRLEGWINCFWVRTPWCVVGQSLSDTWMGEGTTPPPELCHVCPWIQEAQTLLQNLWKWRETAWPIQVSENFGIKKKVFSFKSFAFCRIRDFF